MTLNPFLLLCGTGLFAIFSTTASKSPVLPLFTAHLGGSPAEVGLVAAVSPLAGILFSIPAGVLSDRFGRRAMLLGSAAVFASAPFLYLLDGGILQLAVIRLYHGLATAIFVPVAMAYVSELHEESKGEKLGWFSSATLLGRFMAPVAGGGVLALWASEPALSFDLVYLMCGAAGIVALLGAVRLPKPRGRGTPAAGWQETLAGLKALASSRALLLTGGVEAAILYAYGTLEVFLPLYALSLGLGAFEVGLSLGPGHHPGRDQAGHGPLLRPSRPGPADHLRSSVRRALHGWVAFLHRLLGPAGHERALRAEPVGGHLGQLGRSGRPEPQGAARLGHGDLRDRHGRGAFQRPAGFGNRGRLAGFSGGVLGGGGGAGRHRISLPGAAWREPTAGEQGVGEFEMRRNAEGGSECGMRNSKRSKEQRA